MQVTMDQALHIAIYLQKGAFKESYRDICVPIGEESVIGIEKRGRKSTVYIKKNDKYDKNIRLPLFDSSISMEDLTGYVVTAIESSELLKDVELNMSKVPAPSIEALNALKRKTIVTIVKENDEADPAVEADYYEAGELPQDDDKITPAEPILDEPEPSKEPEADYFDEIDEFDKEPDPDVMPVQMDDSDIPPAENYPSEDEYPEKPAEDFEKSLSNTTVDNISSDIVAADPKTRDAVMLHKIQHESYLNNIITDDLVDLTPDVTTIFKRLSERAPERATQIYINCIMYALELYNYDAVQMSEDLIIDKRNITIALLEHDMRH